MKRAEGFHQLPAQTSSPHHADDRGVAQDHIQSVGRIGEVSATHIRQGAVKPAHPVGGAAGLHGLGGTQSRAADVVDQHPTHHTAVVQPQGQPRQGQAWFGQHQQQQCSERSRDQSQRPPHHSLQTQAGLAGPNQQQQRWKAGGNTTGDQGDPHRGTNHPGPGDLKGSIESLGSVDEVAHNHRPLSHWPGQLQIQLCSPAEGDPGAGHGHQENQHA